MVELTFPLAPAEKYAWPGGYPIAYLCDDGEYLCADCVNDENNPVHMGGDNDGWRIEALIVNESGSNDLYHCAHCGRGIE